MTEYNPPISERETEELIEIANCNDENIWQREATLQAKKELVKRNISQEEQNEVIEKWDKILEEKLKEEAARLEKNKIESYTKLEMLRLFLFGPLIFMDQFPFGSDRFTLVNLRDENYYLKFKQRIILFILSFIAWFFFVNYTFEQTKKERQKEIDKIDISDWKTTHGYE
ncbi:hypothetical protein ACFQ0I_15915 [Mariniflexile aquimaris]|uniref:Uncharacterized protein n=1 Tax=Mariniflexile aquimaris TaxID=881009 RepID=A0ABW3BWA9_9FLAO